MNRIQDYIGKWITNYTHSAIYPNRQERNSSIKEGVRYHHFFYSLSPEEQDKEALKTLQKTITQARQTVPYYAHKLQNLPVNFPQSFAEYRLLEPLSKKDIRGKKDKLISSRVGFDDLVLCATSGSTGEPTVTYSSQEDLGWRLAGEQYFYSLLGCSPGCRVARLYGGEIERNHNAAGVQKLKNWFLNRLSYDCLTLSEDYLLQAHRGFTKFAPDIIIAYSSAVYLLALALDRKNIRPTYPRRVILCAAEKLESYQRAVVENVFDVPVVERYGSRDIGQMAFQLPHQGHDFQIDRCACLIEPDGTPDENGVAPILVTTLRNQAMPLLRYRIDDLARFPLTWTPEQSVSTISEIVGRTCDYILLPDQKKISGGMMDILFQDRDVNAYQVVQHADASVQVKIVPGPTLTRAEQNEIQRVIRQQLSGLAVEFEYPAEIKRTTAHAKLRPVVSHLELSSRVFDQTY